MSDRAARTRALARRGLSFLPSLGDLAAARRAPGRDLLAGLTVAVVALPLALAFGEASGLGAGAGITTAVIAGAIAAIFGGSNLQVSGPTGAMTVVLVPVVAQFGSQGVLQVGLLAGVILVILAVSGVGRIVRFLPATVVEGFTAGIAVVIALQQAPNALGIEPSSAHEVWRVAGDAVLTWAAAPDPVPPLTALAVAAVIIAGSRWRPGVPWSLLAIAAATAAAVWAPGLERIGALPPALPAPDASFVDPGTWLALAPSAFAVAALAALESLLCATVADGMRVGERHDPDRELFGQGLANLAVPFFGGVPATAAIARTAVNVRAGARSRLAALTHSLVLLAIVLALGPVVGLIPLAALAGVLLATTVSMIELRSLVAMARATRADAAVLILTFGLTVVFDLILAVVAGLAIAGLLALRDVSRAATLERVPLDDHDHADEENELLHEGIVAYRFDGPVFFGAAPRFLVELTEVADVRALVLRMSRVSSLDATGALMLDDAIRNLERRGIAVFLSGVQDRHRSVLRPIGSLAELSARDRVFARTPDAIAAAREHVRAPG
ncbi:SulP family inorganic anion transporter [Microbacterium sp. NPDC003461]